MNLSRRSVECWKRKRKHYGNETMLKLLILELLMGLVCRGAATAADQGYYRAAVVDYNVQQNASLSAHDVMMMNAANYENFIREANKSAADIIVFPEGGLGGPTAFVIVPDPALNITPALNSSWDLVLQRLSQYARTYNIYVVVNLHENYTEPSTKAALKYNTNVVFNRQGTVISRYRKFHLYGENGINVTKDPEYSIFETDFGVKFGQFICFDILFKEPALTLVKKHQISNFVYPSQWFSELPFFTSIQAQWGWAVANNVNLLSSGVNNVARGSVGSSILKGARPQTPLFAFTDYRGNTLLIDNVPKNSSNFEPYSVTNITFQGFEQLRLTQQPGLNETNSKLIDLPVNNSTEIGNARFNEKLCHGKLCCSFNLRISYDHKQVNPMIYYRAVVFDGSRKLGIVTEKYDVQYCAIITCTSTNINDCGKLNLSQPINNTVTRSVLFNEINISGNFLTADANPQPNVLLWPFKTFSFLADPSLITFTTSETSTELVYNKNQQIITVGIHSRVFSRSNGAFGIKSSNFLVFLTALIPIAAKCFKAF